MTLAELTYYAFLLRNDLHHIHLHAAGPQFDKVHSITDELYDEAQDEVDSLAEMAIAEGCEVKSFTEVRSVIDDSQWPTIEGDAFDMPAFVEAFDEIGHRYLDAIEDCDCNDIHRAALDEIALFWDKEVNFFNAARQVETGDCPHCKMQDTDTEEGETEDPFSNEEDLYSYEDAMDDSTMDTVDNGQEYGLQSMSTDMLVSGMASDSEEAGADLWTSTEEETEDDDDSDEWGL